MFPIKSFVLTVAIALGVAFGIAMFTKKLADWQNQKTSIEFSIGGKTYTAEATLDN